MIQKIIKKKYIILILLIMIILSVIIYKSTSKASNEPVNELAIDLSSDIQSTEEETKNTIFVDIKGAVEKPGVYEIEQHSHVIDIINKAGGLKKNANTRYINLSKQLNDGDVIIINTETEIKTMLKENKKEECVCETLNVACIEDNEAVISEIQDKSNESHTDNIDNKIININKATMEELMSLTGIGEAKAKNIIDYRTENGDFNNIEDIKNVTGISDAIYDKIKKNITIR